MNKNPKYSFALSAPILNEYVLLYKSPDITANKHFINNLYNLLTVEGIQAIESKERYEITLSKEGDQYEGPRHLRFEFTINELNNNWTTFLITSYDTITFNTYFFFHFWFELFKKHHNIPLHNIEFFSSKRRFDLIKDTLDNRIITGKIIHEKLDSVEGATQESELDEKTFNNEILLRTVTCSKSDIENSDVLTFYLSAAQKLDFDPWETCMREVIPVSEEYFYFSVGEFEKHWNLSLELKNIMNGNIIHTYDCGIDGRHAEISFMIETTTGFLYFDTSHLYY